MIATTDGISLFTKNYLTPTATANVLVVHGFGEHCERYAHVADALNGVRANVYTFDLRGHGKSEGEPFLIKNIDEYRDDVETVYRTIPKDKPLFVLAHSMGGLIAIYFLLFSKPTDICGVVLSAPAIKEGDDINFFTKLVARILGKIAPKLQLVKVNPKYISRNPEEVQKYITDPLVYNGGIKAGLGLALLNAIAAIKSRFADFAYPVLVMHGEADKVANIEGTKEFYSQCTSADKTLKIWEGAYHEIFNETNKAKVIAAMTDWVKTRI